jgi:hypothetical protein
MRCLSTVHMMYPQLCPCPLVSSTSKPAASASSSASRTCFFECDHLVMTRHHKPSVGNLQHCVKGKADKADVDLKSSPAYPLDVAEISDPHAPNRTTADQQATKRLRVRTARRVVRQCPQMHDRGADLRRAPDLAEIEEVSAVGTIKPHHVVAEAFQVVSYRRADVTPMPGDGNSHAVRSVQ